MDSDRKRTLYDTSWPNNEKRWAWTQRSFYRNSALRKSASTLDLTLKITVRGLHVSSITLNADARMECGSSKSVPLPYFDNDRTVSIASVTTKRTVPAKKN